MRQTNLWVMLAAAMILAGCANSGNNGPIAGVSTDQADKINSARNVFERSSDPPITAETHFAAGQLAEAQGDFSNALKQYKQALKLEPNHVKSIYHQAVCYSQLKKFTDAAANWKRYIEVTGGDANGYSNLGFCHELAGEIDQAETAYLRGIEKDGKNIACRTNYGLMLARINRTSEAMLQLQAVLTPAEVHYNLASVLEHQGRKEAAKVEYHKALELDPRLEDAQTRLSALQ